jgi:2-dehydro-3-deoxyphosphogluconate aldolase / (4S)-4-hydroxy-2-oxoglutarate aldolase
LAEPSSGVGLGSYVTNLVVDKTLVASGAAAVLRGRLIRQGNFEVQWGTFHRARVAGNWATRSLIAGLKPYMTYHSSLDRVGSTKIVAVIRAESGERLADVAAALLAGGVEVMEVTFTVPRAHQVLEQVAKRLGSQILLGAGTVLDTETARIAILSGAEFVVSPTVNRRVIRLCRRYGKLVMPGAFTPTEVLTAWESGADIVKVFPCDVGGPPYLKALAGPLPQVRLLPTGGVNLETAAAFLKAGAFALGVGGSLVDPHAVARGDLALLESQARQFAEIARQHRA